MRALSPKERKVLKLVALGCEDKEISAKLEISYSTVRGCINKIILKLQAKNRANAAIIYSIKNHYYL
jgi:DNA-binding NarL/FixJ family response regulator